jgi:thiol-disulfide isomerase/thioredoxin
VPDTIAHLVDELIARVEGTEEVFKYMVHTITHKYETSEIMGMDAVFAHMALTYYCPGKNGPGRATWMEAEQQEKLCERARKLAPLTLGRKAPNIILTDTTEQRWIGMHDLPNEYILLVFWDPHCGVCKKELPKIKEVYDAQLKAMDVEVFTVAKAVDESLLKDWKKFIREKELDWVNVGLGKHVYEEAKKDPRKFIPAHTTIESLNYAETYDVYSTPKMFLLDGDRRFVGKQLTPEQVVDLVTRLREVKAKQ